MSGEGVRRLLAVAVLVAVVALVGLGAWRGWLARTRRQGDIPAPAAPPAQLGAPELELAGTYVTTTRAGDWLDRVTAHGLGPRAAASLAVSADGVVLRRSGAPELFIPAGDVVGVGVSAGMAGKVPGRAELLVLRWRSGTAELDTGFRPGSRADRAAIGALAQRLGAELGTTGEVAA